MEIKLFYIIISLSIKTKLLIFAGILLHSEQWFFIKPLQRADRFYTLEADVRFWRIKMVRALKG